MLCVVFLVQPMAPAARLAHELPHLWGGALGTCPCPHGCGRTATAWGAPPWPEERKASVGKAARHDEAGQAWASPKGMRCCAEQAAMQAHRTLFLLIVSHLHSLEERFVAHVLAPGCVPVAMGGPVGDEHVYPSGGGEQRGPVRLRCGLHTQPGHTGPSQVSISVCKNILSNSDRQSRGTNPYSAASTASAHSALALP